MADITMCKGIDCPIKEECYRYTDKADELWQSNTNRYCHSRCNSKEEAEASINRRIKYLNPTALIVHTHVI